MKPHGFHREAEEEYAAAALDYAQISAELGGRFYDEIERLIAEVCRRPTLYRIIRPPAIRRHFSTTFPFGVLHEDKPDHVRILASCRCIAILTTGCIGGTLELLHRRYSLRLPAQAARSLTRSSYVGRQTERTARYDKQPLGPR